jgi:hypothetical protein
LEVKAKLTFPALPEPLQEHQHLDQESIKINTATIKVHQTNRIFHHGGWRVRPG